MVQMFVMFWCGMLQMFVVSDVLVCDDVANVCDVANVTCNLLTF